VIVFVVAFLNKLDIPVNQPSPTQAVVATFYIGWGDGAFARECKGSECNVVRSFTDVEALELPYASINDLPDWIDMSGYCKEECFAHKEVFTEDPNTSTIIADWEDRTALILCSDKKPFDPSSLELGSGLLTWSETQPAVVTAKHVIDTKELCRVYLPKQGYKEVDGSSFKIHEELDLGIILLGEYNNDVDALAKEPINVCEGLNGEEIKFLGYPEQIIQQIINGKINTPSSDGGAISNQTREQYFITDDIGHGYSGGIAIKKESGCYLGIPIGVVKGRDRIGDTGIILKVTNLKYDMVKGFGL